MIGLRDVGSKANLDQKLQKEKTKNICKIFNLDFNHYVPTSAIGNSLRYYIIKKVCRIKYDGKMFPNSVEIFVDKKNKFISVTGKNSIDNLFPFEVARFNTRQCCPLIRETIKIIGSGSFIDNQFIKYIVFPASLEEIKDYSFTRCNNLKIIMFNIGSKLKIIGKSAFEETEIESIEFPSSLKEIGDLSFYRCQNLVQIKFQLFSNLRRIGHAAFSFTSIEEVDFPMSVIEIGEHSFNKCKNLQKIMFHPFSRLELIGTAAFYSTSIREVCIPENVVKMGFNSFGECKELKIATFAKNSKLAEIECFTFLSSSITKISIPESVKAINKYAFENCKMLQNVLLSNSSLKLIDEGAFKSSGIESFYIPTSVEVIKKSAFDQCENLTYVFINNGSKIYEIGRNAFRGTKVVNLIFYYCSISEIKNIKNLFQDSKTVEIKQEKIKRNISIKKDRKRRLNSKFMFDRLFNLI